MAPVSKVSEPRFRRHFSGGPGCPQGAPKTYFLTFVVTLGRMFATLLFKSDEICKKKRSNLAGFDHFVKENATTAPCFKGVAMHISQAESRNCSQHPVFLFRDSGPLCERCWNEDCAGRIQELLTTPCEQIAVVAPCFKGFGKQISQAESKNYSQRLLKEIRDSRSLFQRFSNEYVAGNPGTAQNTL
jgi:hypothetical protein